VLGQEHPLTLISMANFAGMWKSQGRTAEAIAMISDVVDCSSRQLGEEHPLTRHLIAAMKEWSIKAERNPNEASNNVVEEVCRVLFRRTT